MRTIAICVILLAGCSQNSVQEHIPPVKQEPIRTPEFKTLSVEEKFLKRSFSEPVLFDFGAPWCHYCRQMEPAVDAIEKDFPVFRINTDESPDLKQKYKIHGLPTFLIIYKGQVVNNFVGAVSEAALRDALSKAR